MVSLFYTVGVPEAHQLSIFASLEYHLYFISDIVLSVLTVPSRVLTAERKQIPTHGYTDYEDYRHEADTCQVRQDACFVSAFYLLPFKQSNETILYFTCLDVEQACFHIADIKQGRGIQVFSRNA